MTQAMVMALSADWRYKYARHQSLINVGRDIAFAVVIGLVWGEEPAALAILPLIVFMWARAKSRVQAFLIMCIYYLVASRCLVPGIASYFAAEPNKPNYAISLFYWLLANSTLAAAWAVCWGRSLRPIRTAIALVVTAIPPVGIVGWASPLMAAGIWFPSLGWIGLILYYFAVIAVTSQSRKAYFLFAALGLLALDICILYTPSAVPKNFISIETRFGAGNDLDGEFDRFIELERMLLDNSSLPRDSVLVFPEAISNQWELNGPLLADRAGRVLAERGITALIGGQIQNSDGSFTNAVYSIGAEAGSSLTNRVPVPAGLWHPWSPHSATTAWFGRDVISVGNRRVAALICYEQVVVWPALFSAMAGANLFIAPANVWFGANTSLAAIERQGATSLGRLFGIPVVFSVNR